MTTREELLAAFADNPNLCDLGYEFAELDRHGYCLWVINCARHLFPLAEQHLCDSEMTQLANALECGQQFLDGTVTVAAVNESLSIPRGIADSYCASHGKIPYYLAETLDTIAYAIALTLPNSQVFHEDVIYAAAVPHSMADCTPRIQPTYRKRQIAMTSMNWQARKSRKKRFNGN